MGMGGKEREREREREREIDISRVFVRFGQRLCSCSAQVLHFV